MSEMIEGVARPEPVGLEEGDASAGTGVPGSQVAKIRCLDEVRARGFTFAKGKVVDGVPLAHAEYLAGRGKAEVLEVS